CHTAPGPPAEKGFLKTPRRRSHAAARRPPPKILCPAARRYRGAAPSVLCLHRNGGRPPGSAGVEVKMTTHPPRLAIWLLTRRLSAEWRDFVVGDLEEEFATRSVDSPLAAHAWFWWQTLRCLAAPPPVRTHPLLNEKSQGDSMMRTLFADLRYAFRVMSRTPSFPVAALPARA